jgi:hypothetical protein
MNWQPIETAPKPSILDDPIIVWSEIDGIDVAFWEERGRSSHQVGWYSATDHDEWEYERLQPTHWMPLPEPPK